MNQARLSRRVDELLARGIPLPEAIAQAVQVNQQATGRVVSVEITPGVYGITTAR